MKSKRQTLTNAKYMQRNREKLLIKFALLLATLVETSSLTESLNSEPDRSVLETHLILIVSELAGPQVSHFRLGEVWIAGAA